MIIRSYLVTLWALLFVSCGPTVAQSVAVFDFELIDTSLEGAIRGSYSGPRAGSRSSISRQSQARRWPATCKRAVAAISSSEFLARTYRPI